MSLKKLTLPLALMIAVVVPASAQAATGASQTLTLNQVRSSLPPSEAPALDRLSPVDKRATLEILADPTFGQPGQEAAAQAKWPQVRVINSSGTSEPMPGVAARASVAPAAQASGYAWVQQDWTIAGITYTKIRTRVDFVHTGSRVDTINACSGTYANYVPLRSITGNNYSSLSGGNATCKTLWTIDRPLQATKQGTQGLKSDGNGTILQRWDV